MMSQAIGIFHLHYNLMGPPSHMRAIVDQNVTLWHMTALVRVVARVR